MCWPSPDLPKHFLSPSEAYKHSACIEHLATSRKAAKRRFLKSNRRIVRIVSQICACFFSNVSGISKNPLKSGVNIHKNYIQLLCGSDSTEFTPSKPQFTKSLPYSASGIVSQICAGFFAKAVWQIVISSWSQNQEISMFRYVIKQSVCSVRNKMIARL